MTWMEYAEVATQVLEAIALVVIFVGITWSFSHTAWRFWRGIRLDLYTRFRGDLARSILVGLELLVGADIVRTLGRAPDFYELGTLAAIVFIRSFLSASMEMELEGRWPWQKLRGASATHRELDLQASPLPNGGRQLSGPSQP